MQVGTSTSGTTSDWDDMIYTIAILFLFVASCGHARGPVEEVSGARAFDYLLGQVRFGPRNPGSEGHASCREYLTGELAALVDSVELMHFQPVGSNGQRLPAMTNIIGRIAPTQQRRYLLCAHWDTRPRADRDPDTGLRAEPIVGANDGASGVATLLEVATVLRRFPPPVGVDIVLFDGEDYGEEGNLEEYFLGSRELARQWLHYRPELGILVDMVGDRELHLPKEGISFAEVPWLVDKVWGVAERVGERAFEDRVGPRVLDDHVPLLEVGWPVIDIIDFDYQYWHTLGDTSDKCSPGSLRAVSRVIVGLIFDY